MDGTILQMRSLLKPAAASNPVVSFGGVLLLLALSAVLVVFAPGMMPAGYSWLSHSISESAAQGLNGAWIARFGFLCFGFAVLWLSQSLRGVWGRAVWGMHGAFGVFMVATAAFSHRPWLPGVPLDSVEDFLHSVTATGMGFAFSFGVVFRLIGRPLAEANRRWFDLVALACATGIPVMTLWLPGIAGGIQRLMFLVAYLWYGREAFILRSAGASR